MKKIIEYGLVTTCDNVELVNRVAELLKERYQPYQNPWSIVVDNVEWFYQAMVKYSDD